MSLATLLFGLLCATSVFGYYSVPGNIYGKKEYQKRVQWNRSPSAWKYRVLSWGPHSRPDFLLAKRNTPMDELFNDDQLVSYGPQAIGLAHWSAMKNRGTWRMGKRMSMVTSERELPQYDTEMWPNEWQKRLTVVPSNRDEMPTNEEWWPTEWQKRLIQPRTGGRILLIQ